MTHASEYGETWAAVYDELHAPPSSEVVDFLVARARGGPVLELAVGTGRVAAPLVEAGIEVHGIEISPSMIERLHRNLGEAVPIVANDMTAFTLDRGYPIALLGFNTLFGPTDPKAQANVFTSIHAALEPDGVFVIDCFVPDLGRFADDQSVRVAGMTDHWVRIDYSIHEPDRQLIRTIADIRWLNGRTHLLPVTIRYLWPDQIDELAARAGLALAERYGWYDEAPFTDASSHHVSVYRKV